MKKNIIVIDPLSDIGGKIKEQVESLGGEYEFFWLNDLNLTEATIDKNEVEIIVVDFNPEMEKDITILKNLKKQYPQIYIVAFVSSRNKMDVNDIYGFAHLILEVPCSIEKLKYSFSRRSEMLKYLNNGKLMGLINGISDIPTIPETYLKLDKEISSGNFSIRKISSILSEDLSFTVKILHVVNNPFFGLKYKINNVLQAVSLLGVNIIKSLVLYHHTFSISKIGSKHKKYYKDLWVHSNKVGRYAQQILYDTNISEIEMMEV